MSDEVGRPKLYAEQRVPLKVVSVRLPFVYIRVARRLGDGSPTLGIRRALALAVTQRDREDENDKT